MSDVYLLAFGCGVSFITAAGAYTYLREAFTFRETSKEREDSSENAEADRLRDVA
jgi:hypothetical protein